MMSPRSFLLTSLASLFVVLAAYGLAVDRLALASRDIPFSYRQNLLQIASDVSGKVVVESGSNSVHAIDPVALSARLQRPVLITADNVGYPLRMKLENVAHSLQAGDLLLMPLEWQHFQPKSAYPDNYLEGFVNHDLSLAHFYARATLPGKLDFIYRRLPPQYAWQGLWQPRDRQQMVAEDRERVQEMREILARYDAESFGGTTRDGPEKSISRRGCAIDVFGHQLSLGWEMSDGFRANLRRMAALQERGVQVILTWPAVADSRTSKCYDTGPLFKLALTRYAGKLRDLAAGYGIPIVGEPFDSYYSADCELNTYYHIRASCSGDRTDKLATTLIAGGLQPPGFETLSQEQFAGHVARGLDALM